MSGAATVLAYVFWHWRRPDADFKAYEQALRNFQRALAATRPPGYLQSFVFRLAAVPWLESPGPVYEEWYLTEGSAALDPLNAAAVAGACQEPHDRAARAAGGGTAGLYRLRAGDVVLAEARHGAWFAKPRGVSYPDFYQRLRPWTERAGASLWGRQMTLGPAPEFCLRSPVALDLPADLQVFAARLELLNA